MNAEEPLDPAALRACPRRLRVDRLRRALREGRLSEPEVRRDLPAWRALFGESDDPALRVLLLELMAPLVDDEMLPLLEQSRDDRADGVRLASLEILSARDPARVPELARAHADDDNLEVRLLLGMRLFAHDRGASLALLLDAIESEAGGLRELHALERVTEFLVEDVQARECIPRLRELRKGCHDPEGFLPWAIERLGGDANA